MGNSLQWHGPVVVLKTCPPASIPDQTISSRVSIMDWVVWMIWAAASYSC
jgi:hypothetical protein